MSDNRYTDIVRLNFRDTYKKQPFDARNYASGEQKIGDTIIRGDLDQSIANLKQALNRGKTKCIQE